ncbi:MurR/RpiR family transcriptional regulator [Jongsikchunia kroppenstedtii]|uniref:MurR/RpiR family transcriptional regulator n=1 Tax=Jongsikchunia kroppenstedtii TaxID=1121721 RepID=UPI000363280D|nr:MurR/RpiR family transcriptional regulator [Jongsikchunia kroppenstedtii]
MDVGTWIAERRGNAASGTQAEKVLRTIATAPQFASYASGRELAERSAVNASTVVRTAQMLGFQGWPDFRHAIRAVYLESTSPSDVPSPVDTDAVSTMLRLDTTNVGALATAANIETIRTVAGVIKQSRRTVILTTGSGAGPAHVLGYLGRILGHDIRVADGSATSQTVEVSALGPGDCLVVISVWRLTRVLRELTRVGRQRGASVAVLTDLHSSPLAEDADHLITTPIEGHGALPSLTAMTAAAQAILAALFDSDGRQSARDIEKAWDAIGLLAEDV